jgi:hypothetical protein
MPALNERRTSKRRSVNFKVRHTDPRTQKVVFDYAKDVSSTGLFIRTKRQRPIGATIEIEFPIGDAADSAPTIRTRCQVSRATPEGIAARFMDLDPDSALLLNLILAK